MQQGYDHLFRIILIGDSGTGKTNIITQYFHNIFDSSIIPTIGVEFEATFVTIKKDVNIRMQAFGISGGERFRSVARHYFKGLVGCLLVYDITNYQSFMNIKAWFKETRTEVETNCSYLLIGNKSDLEEQREVKREEAEEFAGTEGIKFMETSAKEYYNIEEIFTLLIYEIYEHVSLAKEKLASSEKLQQDNIAKLNTKSNQRNRCY